MSFRSAYAWDAIVVGGGPVGTVAALALLRKGNLASVLCIDGKRTGATMRSETSAPSPRHTAVAPRAEKFLRSIGAFTSEVSALSQPFRSMHVWDGRLDGQGLNVHASDIDANLLGRVVELETLEHAAADAFVHTPGAEMRRGTYVNALRLPEASSGHLARVVFSDGSDAAARLIVGADGSNSVTRRLARMRSFSFEYEQEAVSAIVKADGLGQNALQRFLPSGPLALLPMRSGHAGVVWSTRKGESQRLMQLPSESFCAEVMRALQGVGEYATQRRGVSRDRHIPPLQCPEIANGVERILSPLRFLRSRSSQHRVVLVGDAMRTIHPLAGQGLNLAFGDCENLALQIARSLSIGIDFGDRRTLQGYEAGTSRQSSPMEAAVHTLQRASSLSTSLPISTALWAANTSSFMRCLCAAYATDQTSLIR